MDAASLAIIEQIVSVLIQAVQAGIKYGPDIIADLKLAYTLATSGTTLTPDQQAQADTALANAHKALQDAVATDAQTDGVAVS